MPESPLPRRRIDDSQAHERRRLVGAPAAFSAVALALVLGFAGWLAANRIDHGAGPIAGPTAPVSTGSAAAPAGSQPALQDPTTEGAAVVQQTSAGHQATTSAPTPPPTVGGGPAPGSSASSTPEDGQTSASAAPSPSASPSGSTQPSEEGVSNPPQGGNAD